jgi:hypothetical protein
MRSYLKVEFTTEKVDPEKASAILRSVIENALFAEGLEQKPEQSDLIVNLEKAQDMFVVETAVVVAVIGLAKELIVLYRTLKEKDLDSKLKQQETSVELEKIALEREKLKLEQAKFYVKTLSEAEQQKRIDDFVAQDLPLLLQRAGIQEVKALKAAMIEQGD